MIPLFASLSFVLSRPYITNHRTNPCFGIVTLCQTILLQLTFSSCKLSMYNLHPCFIVYCPLINVCISILLLKKFFILTIFCQDQLHSTLCSYSHQFPSCKYMLLINLRKSESFLAAIAQTYLPNTALFHNSALFMPKPPFFFSLHTFYHATRPGPSYPELLFQRKLLQTYSTYLNTCLGKMTICTQ